MQSFCNDLGLFAGNWLGTVECWQLFCWFQLVASVECWQLFWAGITNLVRKKNTYSCVFKNAAIEKPNVGGFSCVSKCSQR